MAGNGEQAKPLGICHRLFNFVAKSFAIYSTKRITLGPSTPKIPEDKTSPSTRNQLNPQGVIDEALWSQVKMADDTNDEARTIVPVQRLESDHEDPRTTQIPVQHIEDINVEKKGVAVAAQDVSEPAHKKGSKRKEMLKKKPSMSRKSGAQVKDDMKDKEENVLKKNPSMAQVQEKDGGPKVLRPVKPKLGEAMDIDEKSGAFIQSKRESLKAESSIRSTSKT